MSLKSRSRQASCLNLKQGAARRKTRGLKAAISICDTRWLQKISVRFKFSSPHPRRPSTSRCFTGFAAGQVRPIWDWHIKLPSSRPEMSGRLFSCIYIHTGTLELSTLFFTLITLLSSSSLFSLFFCIRPLVFISGSLEIN